VTVAAPERQLSATPSFAGLPVCATPGCGTLLSQYNPDPDRLCAACRRRRSSEPDTAAAVDLDRLVAGLLLMHSAMHGEEPLNVGQQLAAMGIEVDSWAVQTAVKHAERRHGLICRGVRGRPGYSVVGWETRYRPVVGCAGVPMERRPDGTFAGVAGIVRPQRPHCDDGQLSILSACAHPCAAAGEVADGSQPVAASAGGKSERR